MAKSEITQLLLIAEKLLTLAESQAETDLTDIRARQKFRRETVQQLDRIESLVERIKAPESIGDLKVSEALSKGKKYAAWLALGASLIAHLLRTFIHF